MYNIDQLLKLFLGNLSEVEQLGMWSGVNGEISRHSGRSRLLPTHVGVDEPSGRTHQESGFFAS